jgi:hypothetical protein
MGRVVLDAPQQVQLFPRQLHLRYLRPDLLLSVVCKRSSQAFHLPDCGCAFASALQRGHSWPTWRTISPCGDCVRCLYTIRGRPYFSHLVAA